MIEEKVCPCCKQTVDIDDYISKENLCIYCLENDDEYQAAKKAENAYDAYIDSRIDEARGK
jgi:hypothetical protein